MSSSRGSSWPRDQTHVSYVSCIGRQVVYYWHHLGSPKRLHATSHKEAKGLNTHLPAGRELPLSEWPLEGLPPRSCCWVLDKDAVKPDEAVLAPFIHPLIILLLTLLDWMTLLLRSLWIPLLPCRAWGPEPLLIKGFLGFGAGHRDWLGIWCPQVVSRWPLKDCSSPPSVWRGWERRKADRNTALRQGVGGQGS